MQQSIQSSENTKYASVPDGKVSYVPQFPHQSGLANNSAHVDHDANGHAEFISLHDLSEIVTAETFSKVTDHLKRVPDNRGSKALAIHMPSLIER